jgi:hypothetical protein
VAIGRRELQQQRVERMRPDLNRPGMSDRNTGTKSARPSLIAARAGGPTKSEIESSLPAWSGATNEPQPAVCKWKMRTFSRSLRAESASSNPEGVAHAPCRKRFMPLLT